jgi:hypothetical protein
VQKPEKGSCHYLCGQRLSRVGTSLIAEAWKDSSADEPKEASVKVPRYDGATLQEANELRWELLLDACMKLLKKTPADSMQEIKSADWKILLGLAGSNVEYKIYSLL